MNFSTHHSLFDTKSTSILLDTLSSLNTNNINLPILLENKLDKFILHQPNKIILPTPIIDFNMNIKDIIINIPIEKIKLLKLFI